MYYVHIDAIKCTLTQSNRLHTKKKQSTKSRNQMYFMHWRDQMDYTQTFVAVRCTTYVEQKIHQINYRSLLQKSPIKETILHTDFCHCPMYYICWTKNPPDLLHTLTLSNVLHTDFCRYQLYYIQTFVAVKCTTYRLLIIATSSADVDDGIDFSVLAGGSHR